MSGQEAPKVWSANLSRYTVRLGTQGRTLLTLRKFVISPPLSYMEKLHKSRLPPVLPFLFRCPPSETCGQISAGCEAPG